jgi:hypothetical protein
MHERALRWKYVKSSFLLLFGSIWALVGTVFFFAGGVPLLVSSGSSVEAANLEGRVIEKGEDADKDGNLRRWLRFSWSDEAGEERSSLVETDAQTWARTSATDTLALIAPSAGETSPRIAGQGNSRTDFLIFAGIGLVVGGVGWGLVVAALRKAGRRAHLVFHGKSVSGTVARVEEVTNVRINRRHPLVLAFEYRDDTGERRTGRSPYLPRGLEERWQPGSSIRVVYDELHPELCEADIFDALAT